MAQQGPPLAGTSPDDGLVLELRGLDAGMLALVGGKAANLGELLSAGLPVPEGFCLTTAAYRQAIGAHGTLLPELAGVYAAWKDAAGGEPPGIAVLAGKARAAIQAAPIPAAVAQAVEHAYRALGPNVPVAVRSSATAEDLPFASFAGQQDTYLNVVGVPAVLDAVRRCWASLWTDRATAYRAGLGMHPAGVALAVVVQRMVDAETAGVMFTANPLTGSRRQVVVDASPGLGESVVSGAVNPDHFVVDALTGRVLERELGAKGIEVRPAPGGGTHMRELPEDRDTACLTDSQLRALARLGLQAQEHFGAPQDTEWAIDGAGALWLTQSRPITTLYPVPKSNGAAGRAARGKSVGGTRAYLCFSLAQGLTRPLTPMGLAAVRLIASSVATAAGFPVPDPRRGPSPYAEAGQRIYVDFTTPIRSAIGRRIIPRVFDIMEARTATVMRRLMEDPAFSVTSRTPFGLLRHVAPVAIRAKVPATFVQALFRPRAALRRLDQFTRDFEASLAPDAGADIMARLDHAEALVGSRLFLIVPAILPLPAQGFAMVGLSGKLLGGSAWDELQTVIRGLPHNVTTEMDLELWRLATAIREDTDSRTALLAENPSVLAAAFHAGELPARLDAGLARFLDRYGQRAVGEIDVGLPRWSEEPAHILGPWQTTSGWITRRWPLTPSSARQPRTRKSRWTAWWPGPPPVAGSGDCWCVPPCAGPGCSPAFASCQSTCWCLASGKSAGSCSWWAGNWSRQAPLMAGRTSSSWTSLRFAGHWPAPLRTRKSPVGTCGGLWRSAARSTTASSGAGTSPGCCSLTVPNPKRCGPPSETSGTELPGMGPWPAARPRRER